MMQESEIEIADERARTFGLGASLFTVLCGLVYCAASGSSGGETKGTWHDSTTVGFFAFTAAIAVLCFMVATIDCAHLVWRLFIIAAFAGAVSLNGWLNGQYEFKTAGFIATFLVAFVGLPGAMAVTIVALNSRRG